MHSLCRGFQKAVLTPLIAGLFFLSGSAHGARTLFAIDASLGLPQLASLELSYTGLQYVQVGVGIGVIPINSILQENVSISTVALNSQYSVDPYATYRMTATSVFARLSPYDLRDGGLYFEVSLMRWVFNADVYGTLQDSTSGTSIPGALSGYFGLDQVLASVSVGYRAQLTKNIFLGGSLGASYMLTPNFSTYIGGSITSVLPFADQALQDSFEQAKTDIDSQIQSEINALRATTTWLPSVNIVLGWSF